METMRTLPTAMLLHTLPDGSSHYDWLMQSPVANECPAGRLWTARVDHSPVVWHAGFRAPLTVIAPHRPAYLTYEGPISRGRGSVRRIAAGILRPRRWTPWRRTIDLHWQEPMASHHRVTLHLGGPADWFEVH